MNWYVIIGSTVYISLGWLFSHKIIPAYIYSLCREVEKVDPRYVTKMWIYIKIHSPVQEYILSVIFYAIWPVMGIAAILKAEHAYSIIRHDWRFGAR